MKKRILASLLSLSLLFSMFTTALATDEGEGIADTTEDVSTADEMSEGKPDAYWGHIPENETFAFVDSRYYDGTDYVKVFNVGFYMGNSGQYYTNGDWTDLTTVYRREDYYKTEEFKNFSDNGEVGDPKPEGYPTNDVGGDAEGKLPSYNAGVYTTLSWTGFEMFGRSWCRNYGIDSVISVPRVTTYVEIWRVEPNLSLAMDKATVERGDEFTATLSITNHFNNYDGLPTAEQVVFSADNAELVSDTVAKTDNSYTATFRATEDLSVNEIKITAGVDDTATNYKPATTTTTLPLPTVTYTVTYTDGVEDETVFADQVYSELSVGISTPPFDGTPSRDGYEFSGWLPEVADTVTGNATYTAVWTKDSGGGGGGTTTRYTLHYESNGGTEYDSERYTRNTEVRLEKVPVREGYTFTGWYADKDLTEKISTIKMTSNKTVYAGWEATGVPDWLNGADHFAYIIGDDEGYVRPLANVTRAETAAIFFRLLKEDVREEYLTDRSGFADVEQGAWYNKAVSTMAALGVVKGYTEDTFAPHEAITRAEFAAICARFDTGTSDGESSFTDISGHWAESEIRRAAQLGWIQGDPDGRFRPNAPITRAEAMTIINRVLNRLPEEKEDLLEGMKEWPDALPGAWYYLAVQEATNSHAYERKGEVYERWSALNVNPDWTEYQ